MASLPQELMSGKTTYTHAFEKSKDVYYPRGHETDASCCWVYCVDKSSGKVYFYNRLSKERVWSLPDLVSAVERSNAGEAPSSTPPVMRVVRPSQAVDPSRASPVEVPVDLATTPVEHVTPTFSAETLSTTKKRIEESLQRKIQERIRSATPSPLQPAATPEGAVQPAVAATAAAVPPPVAPEGATVQPSNALPLSTPAASTREPQQTPPAAASADPNGVIAEAGSLEDLAKSTSRSRSLSVRERLALRRARSNSPALKPEAQHEPTPTSAASPTMPAPSPLAPSPQAQATPPSNNNANETAAAQAGKGSTQQPQSQPLQDDSKAQTLIEKQLYEERRREIIEADRKLQEEKERVLREERIAVERAKVIAEERIKQEQHIASVIAERKRMEQRRLELEKKQLELAQARITEADLKEAAAEDPRHAQEGQGAGKQEPDTFERVAAALGESVSKYTKSIQQSLMESMNASLDEPTARSPSPPPSPYNSKKEPAEVRHIAYDKKFSYEGQVRSYGNRLQKHGAGVMFYDAEGKSFYEGQWKADKKHGRGILSLPHVLYDGQWAADQVHGAGTMQTPVMKLTAAFRAGHVHGNVVYQGRGGDTFVGPVKKTVGSAGTLAFPSQDRVEWKWEDPQEPGTGECAIEFCNGDYYAGKMTKYLLGREGYLRFQQGDEYTGEFASGAMHGQGTYRFANGNAFQGQFCDGTFHGSGTYRNNAQGWTYEGEWAEGRMHGHGTIKYDNGDVWTGIFEKDRRAKGKYVFSQVYQLVSEERRTESPPRPNPAEKVPSPIRKRLSSRKL